MIQTISSGVSINCNLFPIVWHGTLHFLTSLWRALQMYYLLSSLHVSMEGGWIMLLQYHPFFITFVLYKLLLHTTCIYLTNFNQLQNNFYTLLAIIDYGDGLILFWSILAVLQFFLAGPSGWGAGLSIQESLVVAPDSGQPSILPRLIIWVPGIAGDIVVKSNLSPRIGSAVLSYLNPIHNKES